MPNEKEETMESEDAENIYKEGKKILEDVEQGDLQHLPITSSSSGI